MAELGFAERISMVIFLFLLLFSTVDRRTMMEEEFFSSAAPLITQSLPNPADISVEKQFKLQMQVVEDADSGI